MKKLKIVLVGGTKRTLISFEELLKRKDIEIQYAIIQRDYSWDTQWHQKLEKISSENKIPFCTFDSGQKISEDVILKIQKLKSDVIIGGGNWRSLLSNELWKNTKFGYLSLHGSLLPKYRGFANLNWCIINNETEYGMQMYQLGDGIDDGRLIFRKNNSSMQVKISLMHERTIKEILDEIDIKNSEMLQELIDNLIKNNVIFVEQDDSKATWTCNRGPEDGEIDWNNNSIQIFNFIRGQSYPYPGAFSFYKNKKFHIWNAIIPKNPKKYVGKIIGKIIERPKDGYVDVLTGDGIIRITEISVDGEKIKPSIFLDSIKEKLGYNSRVEIQKLQKVIDDLNENIKK